MLSELSIMGKNNNKFQKKWDLREKYLSKENIYHNIFNITLVFFMLSVTLLLFFGGILLLHSFSSFDAEKITQFEKDRSSEIIFSIFVVFVLSSCILIFSGIKNKKYELNYKETNNYIQSIVSEKFHNDLNSQYKSTFLNKNAPYDFNIEGKYRIKLKNKTIADSEIYYDKYGKMNVKIISKIKSLSTV